VHFKAFLTVSLILLMFTGALPLTAPNSTAAVPIEPITDALPPQPGPLDSYDGYNTTADWETGTLANTTTITDRYNQSADNLQLNFSYANKNPNLASYWRFSADDSGIDTVGTNDLANDGANWQSTGKFGGAYEFVRADTDKLYVSGKPTNTDFETGSISVWVNLATVTNAEAHSIFGYGGGSGAVFNFRVDGDGTNARPVMVSRGDGNTPALSAVHGQNTMVANTWYHLVLTSDGSVYKLYLDGVESTTTFIGVNRGDWLPDIDATAPIFSSIGETLSSGGYANQMNGLIDEVKFYNDTLTPLEIVTLYNNGNQYVSVGNWTPSLITQPVGDVLNNITIDQTAWAGNCIDKIEILNATDAVISTDTDDQTTNGTIILDWSDFDTGFNGTYDNGSFKIKLYLKGSGVWTPTITSLNYTTANYSTMAYVKWDGEQFGSGGNGMVLDTIASYDASLDHKILFEPSETIYFNATVTLSQTIADVVVNVTILVGNTDVFVAELWNNTWSFTENVVYNLTEMCGDLVNWTTAAENLYYVKLFIYKAGEVQADNSTNYFQVLKTYEPYLEVESVIWDITANAGSTMYSNGSLIFTTTFQSDQAFAGLWVNISVYNSTGDWYRTLIDNTTVDILAYYDFNITDQFNGGVPVYLNGTDYAVGEYVIIVKWNLTGTLTDRWTYSEFGVIEYHTPGLESDSTIQTFTDGTYGTEVSNFTYGDIVWASGSSIWTTDISFVYVNLTIEDSTGITIAWLHNATYSFLDSVSVSFTTIFGGAPTYNTSLLVNGTYSLIVTYEQIDILQTRIGCQFSVEPAKLPGLEDNAFVGTYNDALNFDTSFFWGDTVHPEGEVTFTIDTDYVWVNATVRNMAGGTEVWLFNASDDYTGGVGIALTTTNAGTFNFNSSLLTNGSYVIVITLESYNITTSYIYGAFSVVADLIPGFEYLNGMTTYSDAAMLINEANFTYGSTVWFDYFFTSTYAMLGDYTNWTVQDSAGVTVLWVANLTLDYTEHIAEGGWFSFPTTSLVNDTYYIFVTIEHEDLYSTTAFYTQFAVLERLIPGMQDVIDLMLSRSIIAPPSGNYTVGETIYCTGSAEFNYDIANVDVRLAVYLNNLATTYYAWPDNNTHTFTGGLTVLLPTIHGGAAPSFSTAGWPAGEYTVQWNLTHADLDNIIIYADFTLGYPDLAQINASCYFNSSTSANNLTNRGDWGQKLWFNGTIGTTYDTSGVWISIMIINGTHWFSTLFNGSHSFISGVNESLTDISGGILNFTNTALGGYKLIITANATGTLNLTTVTEGFTIQNLTLSTSILSTGSDATGGKPDEEVTSPTTPGGAAAKYLILFATNWFCLIFLAIMILATVWYLNQNRKRRRARR